MIRALKIVFILFIGSSFGQENEDNFYFQYFSSSAGDQLTLLSNVAKQNFGRYSLEQNKGNEVRIAAGDNIVVDETGIAIEKNRLITISREEIRENSKYWITDGYLHGVVENDSVLVAPDGDDNYIFLFPVKNYLYEVGLNNKIFQANSGKSYLILTQESNGYWSSLYIDFSNSGISLKEISFEEECGFNDIENKEEISGEYKTYILSPSKEEWESLFSCYLTYDKYTQLSE